jgi:hypothetical protein
MLVRIKAGELWAEDHFRGPDKRVLNYLHKARLVRFGTTDNGLGVYSGFSLTPAGRAALED